MSKNKNSHKAVYYLKGKIIQIVPASNLYAVYKGKYGILTEKVDLFALDDQGNIACLSMDNSGWLEEPTSSSNFVRYKRK
ncbi:MAG: hypothetical protein ACOC6P_04300 [Candidatus Aminicenantaceae bacterium]